LRGALRRSGSAAINWVAITTDKRARTVCTRAGIELDCAILSDGAAEADPFALTQGLLGVSQTRGARVIAPETVVEYFREGGGLVVGLESGHEIGCAHLIFPTGYEMLKGIPRDGHKIISTWCFATSPEPENLWPGHELIWEAADPDLYIRTTEEGRVIVGGEDEDFSDDGKREKLRPDKIETLSKKVRALLPRLDATPELTWGGSFGESETGLPTIGQVPGCPNIYAIMGYGGNGITFSAMASQILAKALFGETDPDARLFAFR